VITIPFQPLQSGVPFSTQITVGSGTYTFTAQWLLIPQRWYFSLTQNGSTVYFGPMVGSPLGYDIPLAPTALTGGTLVYRPSTGNLEVSP
jgi:hypothetical protein